ncbi:MAG: tripartite tricarboxylate transporter substrate binding protein [Pyramidobacter sp.]|nr:tripartite tricarboxylate transporter substrate binding protein [Pyramidobacter sp.]MBQ4491512.1 tripartite tricarboxylate transporter substrate binding protein [Pyramidobacter sp.]MBQ8091576.1 tripartite tricarboxylate transporter substrate binding protein [Pyramidobacter sp.]MBQ9422553.1 tripartite tricarboxylate transporter substrate binding protein [Pyramidobacter sp.]
MLRRMSKMLAVLVLCAASAACAAGWPSDTVRLIVAAKAGGGTDISARIVAEKMSKLINENVIVVNQTEGGGVIAFDTVKEDDEEALNLGFFIPSFFTAYISGASEINPLKDVQCASFLGCTDASYICVRADSPYKTAQDLLDYARANPGKVVLGLSIGSRTHFTVEEFARAAGVQFKYVEAGHVADAIPALLGGHIDVAYLNGSNTQAYVASGQMRALAVSNEPFIRKEELKDVPTFAQIGYPGLKCKTDFFVVASKKASAETLAKINAAFKATFEDEEVIKKFAGISYKVTPLDLENSAAAYKASFETFDAVGAALGVKVAR